MSVSHARGGLAFGPGPVSLVLALAIIGLVANMNQAGSDVPAHGEIGVPAESD